MDIFQAIKAKALRSVLKPDLDYVIRHIYRWYSKTFFTPLEEAYDLPLEEILLHYYECHFESMDHEGQIEAIGEVLESEQDRREQARRDDAQIVDDIEFAKVAASLLPKKKKPAAVIGDPEDKPLLANRAPEPPPLPTSMVKTNDFGLPDISMTFDDNLLREDMSIPDNVERLNLMTQPEDK